MRRDFRHHDRTIMFNLQSSNPFSQNGVSIDRLLTLALVIRMGSITAAAGGDPTRQSQISRQLGELEDALGILLLDRRTKPHSPTADAVALVESCQRFMGEINGIVDRSAGRIQPIRVGAGELVIRHLLVTWIKRMPKMATGLRWEFRNLKSSDIQKGLATAELEIGLGGNLVEEGPVRVKQIKSYGMKLLLPAAIPPGKPGWGLLEDTPVVLLEGEGGFRRYLANCERERGIKLTVGAECTSYPQAVDLADAAGWAVFVPELWWDQEKKSWKSRTLKLPELDDYRHTLWLGWNSQVVKHRPDVLKVRDGLCK